MDKAASRIRLQLLDKEIHPRFLLFINIKVK